MQTSGHFADRLDREIDRKGSPVCIGMDPVYERLPDELRPALGRGPGAALDAICEFGAIVLDAVADFTPIVKFQSACFERYRSDGVEALFAMIEEAHRLGLLVILDAKRGDIGVSAEHYAAGLFAPWVSDEDLSIESEIDGRPADDLCACTRLPSNPDAVTVNSYLGMDGVEPFCKNGCGVFVLVRTSNPGGDMLQSARLEDGRTVAEGVAELVADLAEKHLGESGYSTVGAVVGATKPDDMQTLREIMPRSILLVPGYGAQGGSADQVRPCFNRDGRGAIITASRSVIYAFDPADSNWADAVARAAEQFNQDIRAVLPD